MKKKEILEDVNDYYTEKVTRFGATPQGVDWNSEESQQMRFRQLLQIIDDQRSSFSLLDYGCGFGSLYEFMSTLYPKFNYYGLDISTAMIEKARARYNDPKAHWFTSVAETNACDYVAASGIFNVKMKYTDGEWEKYIIETLEKMNTLAIKGFSFNVLTKYSDKEFMKDNLYYADPCFLFDYCKKKFSKYIVLKHDYPLYEFTMLVKKRI